MDGRWHIIVYHFLFENIDILCYSSHHRLSFILFCSKEDISKNTQSEFSTTLKVRCYSSILIFIVIHCYFFNIDIHCWMLFFNIDIQSWMLLFNIDQLTSSCSGNWPLLSVTRFLLEDFRFKICTLSENDNNNNNNNNNKKPAERSRNINICLRSHSHSSSCFVKALNAIAWQKYLYSKYVFLLYNKYCMCIPNICIASICIVSICVSIWLRADLKYLNLRPQRKRNYISVEIKLYIHWGIIINLLT